MTILINPGSHIGSLPEGVTNTYVAAASEARRWLAQIHDDCGPDIELIEPSSQEPHDGRWTFHFRHTVTGRVVSLETHGLSNTDAFVFLPRQYWRGSSCATPSLVDWAAPGFVQTFRASP